MYEYLYNPYIYTFEASFFGSNRTINEKKHFSIKDFKNLGITLCKSLFKVISKEFIALGLENVNIKIPA